MEEKHDRLLLLLIMVCRCSVYVGHLGVEDFDAVEDEGEVGGYFNIDHICLLFAKNPE